MTTKSLPRQAFEFLAPAGITPPVDGEALAASERTLSGVAYSGELITDHGYWSALVLDLASMRIDSAIPLLCEHDRECTVGMVTKADTSAGALNIEARLFADIDDEAAEIAAKADKGFPWQLSVGIWPSSIEECPVGETIAVNGRTFTGPVSVFRGGRVREISVVAIGADSKTSATVLSAGESFEIPYHEANNMSKETDRVVELEAKVAELSAYADPAKFVPLEAHQAVQAELTALREKEHERAVEALIAPALADGRLLSAQEDWARDLGKSNFSALESFIESTQPNPALRGTQTGGKAPSDKSVAQFKAPAGCVVDPESAALHTRISEFAAVNGVDFATAAHKIGV